MVEGVDAKDQVKKGGGKRALAGIAAREVKPSFLLASLLQHTLRKGPEGIADGGAVIHPTAHD